MKQIVFNDPFNKKRIQPLDFDQMECIENLFLKGETKPEITRVLKQKFSSLKVRTNNPINLINHNILHMMN